MKIYFNDGNVRTATEILPDTTYTKVIITYPNGETETTKFSDIAYIR